MGMKQFEPHIFDYDYRGTVDVKGNLKQLWGKDALDQSLKMWIASMKGESIRNPNRGGFLLAWLLKPITETTVEDIKMTIRDGIYQDFRPYLRIIDLVVEPNYEKRYWYIELKVYSPDLKVQTTVSERVKART